MGVGEGGDQVGFEVLESDMPGRTRYSMAIIDWNSRELSERRETALQAILVQNMVAATVKYHIANIRQEDPSPEKQ